MVLKESFCGSP